MAETLLISPPAVEPVTLAEAKANCRVTSSAEDSLFARWIASAREQVEHEIGRRLVTQTRRWLLDAFPAGDESIKLHAELVPAQSVASIQYLDGGGVQRTLAGSVYALDALNLPGYIVLQAGQSWPTDVADSANAVQVEVVCGMAADAANVPACVWQAMQVLILAQAERREPELEVVRRLLDPVRVYGW